MKQNELRIEDEIKTFDDAVKKIGENHPLVKAYAAWMRAEIPGQLDLVAFLKLRIICAALNEGWQPEFTEDEARYYLWCVLWTEDELKGKDDAWKKRYNIIPADNYNTVLAGVSYTYLESTPLYNSAYFSPLLCLKSAGLAEYCGKQFIDIWADFFLPARKVSPKLEVETYQVDTDKFIKRGEYQETDVDERKRTVDFLITAVDGSRHEVRFNHPVSLAESRSIQKSKDNPNVYYVTDKALAELEKRYSCTTDF